MVHYTNPMKSLVVNMKTVVKNFLKKHRHFLPLAFQNIHQFIKIVSIDYNPEGHIRAKL